MQYLRRPLDKSCSCTTAGCGTEQWPLAGRWQVPRGVGKLDCGVVGDKYRVQRLCWEALGFRPSCDGDEWRMELSAAFCGSASPSVEIWEHRLSMAVVCTLAGRDTWELDRDTRRDSSWRNQRKANREARYAYQ